jgi:hypothetical protein
LIRKFRVKAAPLHRVYDDQLAIKATLTLILLQWTLGKRSSRFCARQLGNLGGQTGAAPAAGGFLR